MTDSKTPEWVERMGQAIADSKALGRAIAEAEQRGYARGRADAVEAVPDEIDLYQMLKRAGLRKRADVAKFVALTIRQLLEVKG